MITEGSWLVKYIIALSPVDSIALISMRPPKNLEIGQVLDPSWTLRSGSSAHVIDHVKAYFLGPWPNRLLGVRSLCRGGSGPKGSIQAL